MKKCKLLLLCLSALVCLVQAQTKSWAPDNGNGTFTNPLFQDEFSDPDIIRVGGDFYLTGTTMHCVPALPVFHSKDLVNWTFLGYAYNRFNLGEEFNLTNGKEAYGQGIWAPCIRYHNGMFYIFSNVNDHGMQVFIAKDPKGPWTHKPLPLEIYDLSVLFDDDGKIYAVYKYDEVHLVELKPDFSGIVEGSEKVIIPAGNAMGEGHHMYKIKGKYYIISANYSPTGRMQCARADKPYGPYETVTISTNETFGTQRGWWVGNVGIGTKLPDPGYNFDVFKPSENEFGAVPLHQGGIVDLPNGDWWGFSMMDFRSVGRTTCLSPVTWQDGWPYFGLPGNLGRTPKTWIKPNVSAPQASPTAPYQRSDDFSGSTLIPVWQWNHNPVEGKWMLNKKKGTLRLNTLPAKDFMWAKNTLTQRVVGPVSIATTLLDATALKPGDEAGLAMLNLPYASLGMRKEKSGYTLTFYDQRRNKKVVKNLASPKVYLRIWGDYENDICQFSYSTDHTTFENIGDSIRIPYQLKTFQGGRYSLYAFNDAGKEGGYAEFDFFTLDEPFADRSSNIPIGKVITLTNLATTFNVWANPHGMMHSAKPGSRDFTGTGCKFRVHDRGQGRVALEALNGTGFLTVVGVGITGEVRMFKTETKASLFLWQDMLHNQCMLLSLKTNRFVGLTPGTGEPYSADFAGTRPDRKDGTCFSWKIVDE